MRRRSEHRYAMQWDCEMARSVTDAQRENWSDFWTTVNEACVKHGGSVVSGIRSLARNEHVGGHIASRHIYGLAADISFLPDHDNTARDRCDRCFAWLYEQGLHGYKRRGGKSLHIQDRAAKAPR